MITGTEFMYLKNIVRLLGINREVYKVPVGTFFI